MNGWKNVKISTKIAFLLLLSTCFLGIVGWTASYSILQLKQNSETMYQDGLIPVKLLNEIRNNNRQLEANTLELMLTIKVSTHKELSEKIAQKTAENEQLLAQYEQTALDPAEKELVAQYKELLPQFLEARQHVVELAVDNRKLQAYTSYLDFVKPINDQLNNKLLESMVSYKQQEADALNLASIDSAQTALWITLSATGIAILAFLVFGTVISRSITKPLKGLQRLMAQAQSGDLRVRGSYVSRDEIGLLTADYNRMIDGLHNLVEGIVSSAGRLSSSSAELAVSTEQSAQATNQIAELVQQVAAGAESQQRGAEQTVATVKRMETGMKQIAGASSAVSGSSRTSAEQALHGNEALTRVVGQMKSIDQSVGTSANLVKTLGERSAEISQIAEVIAGLASQTNLLALNAAIEAARAGEHGRGFSVVADEVRKLAEQSEASSSHISQLIHYILQDTRKAVESMETGNRDVKVGLTLVQEAEEAFALILEGTRQVSEEMKGVSAAIGEILSGTEQTVSAIAEMEQIACNTLEQTQIVVASSEEQLASIEEISASTHALNEMTQKLEGLSKRFVLQA